MQRKKSTVARSVDCGGWGMGAISCFVKKSESEGRNELLHCYNGATIFSPPHIRTFSSLLPLSAFSSHSDNIPCSLSGHKVEICDELCQHNQKTQSASLSHCPKLAMLFWVWVTFLGPIAKAGLLFRHCSNQANFCYL